MVGSETVAHANYVVLPTEHASVSGGEASFTAEARLASLVEYSDDAILIKDLYGVITHWNPAAEKLYGYAAAEVCGRSVDLVVPEDRRNEIHEILERVRNGERFGAFETVRRRKDGQLLHVSLTVSPIRDSSQRVVAASAVARDVTPMVIAREEMKRSAEQLKILNRICRSVSGGVELRDVYRVIVDEMQRIIPFDRSGIVVLVEDQNYEILAQWTRGTPGFATGDRRPVAGSALELVIRLGEPFLESQLGAEVSYPEHQQLSAEGVRSRLLLPMRAGNRVIGMLTFGSRTPDAFHSNDVDLLQPLADQMASALVRERLWKELQEQNEVLEDHVAERTAQLEERLREIERLHEEQSRLVEELESSNESLRDTAESLDKQRREIEAFNYSVSHDLRAPLRAIRGFSEILTRRYQSALDAQGQHYLKNVVEAAGNMNRLIEDLLRYARLGRRGVALSPVSLANVFARLRAELQQRLLATSAGLEVAADLPVVLGDSTLLVQVFGNLLDNALTYAQKKTHPQVEVDWNADGANATIHVRDHGIGIDAMYHQKIFDIFQRLHNQDQYPGTGIGLAIVRKSLSLLGGSIRVESERNVGSTFFVRLPLAQTPVRKGATE